MSSIKITSSLFTSEKTNISPSIPSVSTSSSPTQAHLLPSTSTIAPTMSESQLPISTFNINVHSYLKDQAIVKKTRKNFSVKYTETSTPVLSLSKSNIPSKIASTMVQNFKQPLKPRQKSVLLKSYLTQ
ncbi:hypothetical protein TNCV_4698541 [Trichonephila clavipes]|nr:hypothetical protein TNCV_4698541 [Trichonephila clavipes]